MLLIDEAQGSHAVLERIALRSAAVVHHARHVTDALRYVRACSYDVLILDSSSAEGCLLDVLEQLGSAQPTAALLLIASDTGFPPGLCRVPNVLGSFERPWDDTELEFALRRGFEASAARRAARQAGGARPPFERVLVAGGDEQVRALTALLHGAVSRGGVVPATRLDDAVALLAQQPFDVALTTTGLPDACGLDAILRLRRQSPHTPVVLVTDVDDPTNDDQALQAGAQDVLAQAELDAVKLTRALRHARQRQRREAHLHHDVQHDELTRLAKRALFRERIQNALARSRRIGNTFGVIYIDLDHFKWINDNYGHDVGDGVLVAVSERLRAAVREYDTVARLGGDEFAILLDTLDEPAEAESVAQRVLRSLSLPVEVDNQRLGVTASIGISVFPDGGSAPDDLLRNADQAMYCAKRAGRNTYSLAPLAADLDLAPLSSSRSIPAAALP